MDAPSNRNTLTIYFIILYHTHSLSLLASSRPATHLGVDVEVMCTFKCLTFGGIVVEKKTLLHDKEPADEQRLSTVHMQLVAIQAEQLTTKWT